MPAYRLNDPRLPANRAALVHAAAEEAVGPGGEIPVAVWNKALVQTFKITRQAAHPITQIAIDLDLVEHKPGESVRLLRQEPPEDVRDPADL